MNRRKAIKNLTFAVSGVILIPGCDFNRDLKVINEGFLSEDKKHLLKAIVETIIPEDNKIPGAGKLKVHEYVETMVADCHGKEVQRVFLQGLDKVKELAAQIYNSDFVDLELQEKLEILVAMETAKEEPENQFFLLVKGLSIQGFLTSEYVITNFTDYVMVPGPEYCCTPVV